MTLADAWHAWSSVPTFGILTGSDAMCICIFRVLGRRCICGSAVECDY